MSRILTAVLFWSLPGFDHPLRASLRRAGWEGPSDLMRRHAAVG